MKKIANAILCLNLLILGCSKSSAPTPTGPFVGKTVVFVGDATVGGYDATSTQNRWTSLFCLFMKCNEDNRVGGNGNGHAVFQNGLHHLSTNDSLQCAEWSPFNQTDIPIKTATHGALFIAYGTSDAAIYGGRLTATDYQNYLSAVVDYAVNSRGWSYSQIVIVTPYYITDWNFACSLEIFSSSRLLDHVNAALAVATAKGCVSANVYNVVATNADPSSMLDSSGIGAGLALNDKGHSAIASYLTTLKYN